MVVMVVCGIYDKVVAAPRTTLICEVHTITIAALFFLSDA